MIPALLLLAVVAALPAPEAPQPGEIRTFSDWSVGCDNGGRCEAVALVPESRPEDALTMSLARGPEANALPEIAFGWEEEDLIPAAGLRADGRRLDVRLASSNHTRVLDGEEEVVAALRSAREIALLAPNRKVAGRVSLAGASAALRWMDERQGRAGTVTALVARGAKAGAGAASPLPVVPAPPLSRRPPRSLAGEEVAAVRAATCDVEIGYEEEPASTHRLDERHSLALIPSRCWSGAYNMGSILLVGGEAGTWRAPAFDRSPLAAEGEEDPAVAYNVAWDEEAGLLRTGMKGRGIGDCGTEQDYAWDGSRFRLVREARMEECRGSTRFITTWRAEVRR